MQIFYYPVNNAPRGLERHLLFFSQPKGAFLLEGKMARFNRKHYGCSVVGCQREHEGLGYCKIHYLRFYKYGEPLGKGKGREKQGKSLKCLICGKEKYYIPSRVIDRKHYCSVKCFTKSLIGKHPTIETILKMRGHVLDKSPSWKGGKTVTPEGYVLIKLPNHPSAKSNGYVFEHRLIVEKSLGRRLNSNEHIHHLNGKKNDNRIGNLIMLSNSEHKKLHSRLSQFACEFLFGREFKKGRHLENK